MTLSRFVRIFFMTFFLFLIEVNIYANFIGKAIIVKGKVTVLSPGSMNAKEVKKGTRFVVDSSILTREKSFARLKLNDGSYVNIGANSKLVLSDITRKKPSVVSLLKGKLRAQIPNKTKKIKKNSDYKFYIKTRNASIGVRGTDFLSIHNTKSKLTSVVTFNGKVAVADIEDDLLLPAVKKKIMGLRNREDLKVILNTSKTKVVEAGNYSGVTPAFKNATIPTKIDPKQFELLKRNGNLNFSGKGKIVYYEYDPGRKKDKVVTRGKPEGYYDQINEEFAPRAGGVIDINSGIYVQPEIGSKFNTKDKVFVLGKEFGDVNRKDGNYVPPEGLKVDKGKGFVLEDYSKKDRIVLAKKVFNIKEETLTKKTEKKLESSLNQILTTKKAILNQEVKVDILKTPLDDDEYIYEISKEFNRAVYALKETLDIKMKLFLSSISKVYDLFYDELVSVSTSGASNGVLDLSVAHNSFLSNKWILRPEFRTKFDYNFDSNTVEEKESSNTYFSLKLDSTYNHTIFNIPSSTLFGIKIDRENKLEESHVNYVSDYDPLLKNEDKSLFLRSTSLYVGENIRFNEFNSINVKGQYTSFDGFNNVLNGNKKSFYIAYKRKFLPRYEAQIYHRYSELDSKVDYGSHSTNSYGFRFNITNFLENYSFWSSIEQNHLKYSDNSRNLLNGVEKSNKIDLELSRRINENFLVNFGYTYFDYDSKNVSKKFDSSSYIIGLRFEF